MIGWDARQTERLRIAERPGRLRTLAGILAHSGDSWFWLAGLGLVWAVGTEFWKSLALTLVLSILATALVVLAIKLTVRRKRPEGEWGSFYRRTDPHSFPSGHAVRAVMLAVVVLGVGPAWLSVLLLFWAPLVGLARVAMGLHYLSDVLGGMLIGLLIGLVIVLVV